MEGKIFGDSVAHLSPVSGLFHVISAIRKHLRWTSRTHDWSIAILKPSLKLLLLWIVDEMLPTFVLSIFWIATRMATKLCCASWDCFGVWNSVGRDLCCLTAAGGLFNWCSFPPKNDEILTHSHMSNVWEPHHFISFLCFSGVYPYVNSLQDTQLIFIPEDVLNGADERAKQRILEGGMWPNKWTTWAHQLVIIPWYIVILW